MATVSYLTFFHFDEFLFCDFWFYEISFRRNFEAPLNSESMRQCLRPPSRVGGGLLDDAEEVDVGVVDGEVGDDQAGAAIDPKQLLININ